MVRALGRTVSAGLLATLLLTAICVAAQENSVSPPLLTIDQAIQTAIANNVSLKIAFLDVTKSNWEVAAAKTRRLPAISTYLFASGDLNSPAFTFKQGIF